MYTSNTNVIFNYSIKYERLLVILKIMCESKEMTFANFLARLQENIQIFTAFNTH